MSAIKIDGTILTDEEMQRLKEITEEVHEFLTECCDGNVEDMLIVLTLIQNIYAEHMGISIETKIDRDEMI